MAFPIQHLPVVQNWDCHVCGTCCKEYLVTITADEKKRLEAQGWDRDKDLGGHEPFKRVGWFRPRYQLNHRPDGSCVFLSEQDRCRVHEKFGYETKPLPCRLFPFVLVPTGDHWSVGMRFACPSAAENKGRPLPAHDDELREFAVRLAEREGLTPQPDGALVPPPVVEGSGRVAWPEVLQIRDVLLDMLRNRSDPMERRWRKALALAAEVKQARLDQLTGPQLGELLKIVRRKVEADTPPNLMTLPRPGWMGRILFRQAVALYTRKDHGPNRGLAGQGRIAEAWAGLGIARLWLRVWQSLRMRVVLAGAALRFGRGEGMVPQMHKWLPETTFAEVERPRGPWPIETETILERYYAMKVGALQFCGAASFGLPFWEGLESLALTFPVIAYVARMFAAESRETAFLKALSIVDDHFGFNKVLRTARQRLSFRILARSGELSRLIAWYSR